MTKIAYSFHQFSRNQQSLLNGNKQARDSIVKKIPRLAIARKAKSISAVSGSTNDAPNLLRFSFFVRMKKADYRVHGRVDNTQIPRPSISV